MSAHGRRPAGPRAAPTRSARRCCTSRSTCTSVAAAATEPFATLARARGVDAAARGRGGAGARRPRQPAPRAAQPRRQRDQVHARRRRGGRDAAGATTACAGVDGHRRGPGHRRRAARARLRPLLPRRRGAHAATGGSGLGLAIVGEVARAHGGRVTVGPHLPLRQRLHVQRAVRSRRARDRRGVGQQLPVGERRADQRRARAREVAQAGLERRVDVDVRVDAGGLALVAGRGRPAACSSPSRSRRA